MASATYRAARSAAGSLAEYAAVDARLLAIAPAVRTSRQAAAVPLAAITAWEGLVDRADVGDGDLVLVQGGAGGVGHIVVQIAAARGARVFATGSAADRELVASLGATFIDYRAEPPEQYVRDHTGGEGFDVVFDTIGGSVLDVSFTVVRRYTGRVVSILGWGSHSLAPLSFRGASYSGVFTLPMSARAAGTAAAAPKPCSARATINQASIGANPASSELTANSAIPYPRTRR